MTKSIIQRDVRDYEINHNIQIFYQGASIGDFIFTKIGADIKGLHMFNGRIFGIAQERTSYKSSDEACFYEWNTEGAVVKELPLDALQGSLCLLTQFDRQHYVVSNTQKGLNGRNQFFVFNLETNTSRIFDYDDAEMKINIMALSNDKLICGVYSRVLDIPKCPKICIYNIITGKMEREFDLKIPIGKISHLIANDNFIVFKHERNVYCMNRRNGEVRQFTMPSSPYGQGNTTLSFDQNHLAICYPFKYYPPSAEDSSWYFTFKMWILDLESGQTIDSDVEYTRYPDHHFSFEQNKLLVAMPRNLYIENFEIINSDEEIDESNSIRM